VHDEWAVPDVGVSTADGDVVAFAFGTESFVDFCRNCFALISWEAEREEDSERFCGHGCEVAEVHAEEFSSDSSRPTFFEDEVCTIAKRVGGDDGIGADRGKQGAIIADSKFDFWEAHSALFSPSDKTVFHWDVSENFC
jgi:hypothetical protein